MTDVIEQFKVAQRQGWAFFSPLEALTATAAPRLVRFAGITRGTRVLDVGCGTGVVAVTAARLGAKVTGVDLTPELIEHAKENARIASLEIDWHVGDAEALPAADASFDVVVSQWGHMFAPRPDVTVREMLRVLKPGGTIAFATWPPEVYTGRLFALLGKYTGGPPPGVSPPAAWGDVALVRERLAAGTKDLTFDRSVIRFPALSPQHARVAFEATVGPLIGLVKRLEGEDKAKLASLRAEFEALIETYFEENQIRQDYLLTRAIKL